MSRHPQQRSFRTIIPALILVGAAVVGFSLLNHGEQLKRSAVSAGSKFTDMSPSGLVVVPASGASQVSYGAVCTPNTWDSTNCRRCNGGVWAANCTDFGGPGDPGYTNALWCSCSLRCTGGPNTCQAVSGSINASPATITSGDPSVVSWTSSYADTCTSSDFVTNGSVSGSALVYPSVTKTYTVTCSNTAGSINLFQTVTVNPPPPPAVSLSASPGSITSGSASTLTWSSTNATSCTGTNFTAGAVSGSRSVSPTVSTTYSVTCSGAGGSNSVSVTVTVTSSSCNLPWGGTINSGQSVTAYQSPNVPYGSSCTSQTRTCSNTVLSGSYQYQSCTVDPPPAPTCSVTISPNPVARGGTATVSWSSSNATSFSLTTIGPVTPNTSGFTGVSPSSNTNYGGSVSGPGGSTTCPATLTVTQPSASINVLKL